MSASASVRAAAAKSVRMSVLTEADAAIARVESLAEARGQFPDKTAAAPSGGRRARP